MLKKTLVLLLILASVSSLPPVNAGENQTGGGSFFCPSDRASDCPAGPALISTVIASSDNCFIVNAQFTAFSPCLSVFVVIGPAPGATKDVMVTFLIQYPGTPPLLGARFNLIVDFSGKSQTLSGAIFFSANAPSAVSRTFSFLGILGITLVLVGVCDSSSCASNVLVPKGRQYTVVWNIQDPPGNQASQLVLPLEYLIAIIAASAFPSAVALYLAKRRKG